MPDESAAANDAAMGKPTFAALNTTSPDNRPLEARKHSPKSVWFRAAIPIALSTALCRPTSSANATSEPSALQIAAACTPPVFLKTSALKLSWLTELKTTSALTVSLDFILLGFLVYW